MQTGREKPYDDIIQRGTAYDPGAASAEVHAAWPHYNVIAPCVAG